MDPDEPASEVSEGDLEKGLKRCCREGDGSEGRESDVVGWCVGAPSLEAEGPTDPLELA